MSRSFWRSIVCCGLFALAMILCALEANAQRNPYRLTERNCARPKRSGSDRGDGHGITDAAINVTLCHDEHRRPVFFRYSISPSGPTR